MTTTSIDSPIALGQFESRNCELFFRKFNAPYGQLIAIYPTEHWAKRIADKLNVQIDSDMHLALMGEKVIYRCVDLGEENE